MSQRVYIRGCGIVSALGQQADDIAQACREAQVKPTWLSELQLSETPIPYYQISAPPPDPKQRRLYQLIDQAVHHAITDANLDATELKQTAVFSGSTACDISDLEQQYQDDLQQDPEAFPLYRSGFGVLAGYVADQYHLQGQEYSFNTACSSSANALMYAAHMIQAGRCEHAIVLGVEVFNQLSLQGFYSMMLLSPDACRPFDAKRNGTVLGEAIGAIILSRTPPQQSQFSGADAFYFLSGANVCDTQSITSSNADAIAGVMQQALARANLSASRIDVIKAHGTSTENNDGAEGQGMLNTFTETLPPFTALKPYLGHTLGACGVVEMITLLSCVKQGFIPATPTFENIDENIGHAPLSGPMDFDQGHIMLNYFGFGGNNTSLIISNHP
ncbi:beta-ketoacyl synthase N-terminal-like domain-containing protein [Kaarinaea lacus]